MKKKVVIAGHICLDITPAVSMKEIVALEKILLPGKLIEVGKADVHTGGAVANTGLAMKLLGADVVLVGKIGKDMFGEKIVNTLKQYDAEDNMIISEEGSTSYSVVLAFPGIDRIFLHNSGENDTFQVSDISTDILEEAALFHFGYPPLMKAMYQNDGEQLVKLMKEMKKKEIATSLDMAAVDADSEAGKADWEKILERVLPYVDFFVPSIEELGYMLDKERVARWREVAAGRDITEVLDVESDIKPLADQCIDFGAKVVLIKCGGRGLYYRTNGKIELMEIGNRLELNFQKWADREGFESSFVPERILSGTGAGDVSIAAFLTAMLEGYCVEECVQLAAAMGASCVAEYDALGGVKPLTVLKDKINAGWKKNS